MTANIRPLRAAADSRVRPLPIPPSEKALRAATRAGYDDGERAGYVHGWRVGLGYGLLYGCAIGAAALWAALLLGRLAGG